MILLYSIIVFAATLCGAIAGLGGGVIIKPFLDMIGYHDAATIGFYSCIAVFVMCIVSISQQLKKGFQLQLSTVIYISLGSSIGGLLGEFVFKQVTSQFENRTVKLIQSILLLSTFLFIFIYTLNKNKIKTFHIMNPIVIVLLGIFLGTVSVFLGIGGGPLNVSLLILLFSLDMKQATVYSIATIFFSQLSKLLSMTTSGVILGYDFTFIPFICVSAIIGGFIGTNLNHKLTNSHIEKIYMILIVGLMGITVYNIVSNII